MSAASGHAWHPNHFDGAAGNPPVPMLGRDGKLEGRTGEPVSDRDA